MARPKLGEGDTQRLQLKISEDELEAIETWRFANRIASRSEAVRRLAQLGMRYDEISTKVEGLSVVAVSTVEKMIGDLKSIETDKSAATTSLEMLSKVSQLIYDLMDLAAYMGLQRSHLADATIDLREALARAKITTIAYRDEVKE